MKFYTDRQEIARLLNFGRYPVITMDISKNKKGWPKVYEGCKVKVDWQKEVNGTPMYTICSSTIYVDNYHKGIPDTIENRLGTEIILGSSGTCLKSSFGASDVFQMAEEANIPTVKAGQTVVVVYKAGTKDDPIAMVKLMKVSDRIDRFCSTVATLTDAE